MQTITHPNAHATLISPSGARKSFDGQADSDEIRGDAFQDAHDEASSGDVILLGPGSFASSSQEGKEGVSIIGVPGRTILVPRTGNNSVRYHPRSNQHFVDIRSTSGSCFFFHSEGEIIDPDVITGVKFINCDVVGGEDCIYADSSTSTNWEFEVHGGRYRTQNSPSNANDALFLSAPNLSVKVFGAKIECTGSITGGINMVAFGLYGAGSVAELYDSRIMLAPTADLGSGALRGACVDASGDAVVKLGAGCRLITNIGALTDLYTVMSRTNGRVEICRGVAFDDFDEDLFYTETGGAIVFKDDVIP